MINFLKLWNKSGDQYHDYALKFPQYKETNEKMIELANLQPGQIVVDLASGTGLTTKEVLETVPEIGKIYAVDFSEDMIRIAREFIRSEKVDFIVADAQEFDKFILEKVDVVLCNSAFWQFQNQGRVLKAVSNSLKDNGTLIFNLNQQFFDFGQPQDTQRLIMETIFSEMRERGFEYNGKLRPKINREQLEEFFRNEGFQFDKVEIVDVGSRTLEDIFNFFEIPATATFFEEVPKENQKEILDSAYEKLKGKVQKIENNKWIYFVFKKI